MEIEVFALGFHDSVGLANHNVRSADMNPKKRRRSARFSDQYIGYLR